MRQKSKNIIYIVALAVIMLPIILEQTGNPMTALAQTITLMVGLVILFIGKLQVVNQKRRAGVRVGSHDTLILAVILFMAAYVLYNYFV